MTSSELKVLHQRLKAVVGDDHARARQPETANCDSVVIDPASAAEVSEAVRIAHDSGAAIFTIGAGAIDIPSAPADRLSLYITMHRLCHVLRLDEISQAVRVQAGIRGTELEAILRQRRLTLGDYPQSALAATIGGLLAVRTPGKLAGGHGTIEDAVLGISAVLADGRMIHTRPAPRRATGPDLVRAICGCEGTLAIITSAVLRVHPLPDARFLSSFALPHFDDAISAVHLSLRDEASPAALRVYDRAGANLHFDDFEGGALLLSATAGPTDLAACDRDIIASAASAVDGDVADTAFADRWWSRRCGESPAPCAPQIQVSATPGRQRAVYAAVQEVATEQGFIAATYASRFDIAGGVLFFMLVDGDQRALDGETLNTATSACLAAAKGAGGNLLQDTEARLPEYFRHLKQELDPNRIFNPGRLG